MPRGAYAPRSWWFCGADVCRRNCDLCDTRTLVYRSGGREPAVGDVTLLQTENADRQPHPCMQLGAAGVNPPWWAKPTPRRENRALFSN
jgi:hypothetical protein